MLSNEELSHIIEGCIALRRESQKRLYMAFYGYAMAISLRYAAREEDAQEVVNDGFLKVFKSIASFQPAYVNHYLSLKGWVRQLMIFTAIDHFRRQAAQMPPEIYQLEDTPEPSTAAVDRLSYDELCKAIQQLSPAYRTVFNLFVVDGFSHEEISRQLNISVGASKSNLAKARQRLQQYLINQDTAVYGRRVV